MTVLDGGLFLIEVETAPNVFTECADLTRVTKSNNVTISRTRVFRKTYRVGALTERVYTLAGLLNYADPGQQALLAAERTNTPIRIRWSESGDPDLKSLVTVRLATITHEGTPDPGAIQTVTYEARTIGAVTVTDLREDGSTNDGIRTMGARLRVGWSLENVAGRILFDGAGHVQEIKPINGVGLPSLFGHAGGGATLPSYDAGTGTSTSTGTQNWRTAEDARFDMSLGQVLVVIAKAHPGATGYLALIQKLDFTQHTELYSPDGVGIETSALNFANIAAAFGATTAAALQGYVMTDAAPFGNVGTLINRVRASQIVGRIRGVNAVGSAHEAAGAAAVVIGGVQTGAGGGFSFQPQNMTLSDVYVLDDVPTQDIELFIERRILHLGGALAANAPAINAIGDSRFDGLGLTRAQTAPGQLQADLGATRDVSNRGVSSRSLDEMYQTRARLITPDGRHDGRDRRLWFWGGVNTGGDTAATMITKLRQIAADAFSAGYTAVYVQMESPSLSDPTHADLNAGILAMEADGTITKAIRADLIPEYLLTSNPTWYQDGLHPTAALNTKIKDRFRLDTGI